MDDLHEFVTSWEDMLSLYFQVENQINDYLTTLTSQTPAAYYEQGRLVIPVATIALEGVTLLSKSARVKAILRYMDELKAQGSSKWATFTDKLDFQLLKKQLANRGFDQATLARLERGIEGTDLLRHFKDNPELADAWRVLDDANSPLKAEIDELNDVSRYLDDIEDFGGYDNWNRILRGSVNNGEELIYRLSKIDAPKPVIYSGDLYRIVDNGLDPLHTHYIPRGKSHRYSQPGEDALYFSSSKEGNTQELTHWGKEIEGNTTTFLYRNIDAEGLLDLTNPKVRKQLGISLDQITNESYEFSHILGSWSQRRYKGIIAPSARGVSDNLYFVNIVIFNSGTANGFIKGKELIKIVN
ncbi:hypothetical protein AB9P05_02945 [Roseivirga sp. BDSF3-8]|uniref:hypothetical protein n=1 Tax=Roseivirga sp. BDSF3-8 TaxID=3241598 RepID=UPI003531A4BB